EEEGQVLVGRRPERGLDEAGGGALDVAGAEPDGAIALDAEAERIARPPRVGRDGVDVDVEEEAGRAAGAEEADAPVAEVAHLAAQAAAEHGREVGEDPLAVDDPR